MTIVWSPEAAEDLASLRDYIGNHNPAAARRIASLIVEAVERGIAAHPELGRAGRVPGTRELVIPNTPVIIPYRVRERTLEILGIHHHARRWPDRF
jgi:toxin ParE1/3/4